MIFKTESGRVLKKISGSGSCCGTCWALITLNKNISKGWAYYLNTTNRTRKQCEKLFSNRRKVFLSKPMDDMKLSGKKTNNKTLQIEQESSVRHVFEVEFWFQEERGKK